MREIKFRGRRKNSSEWVYGAFLAIPKLCSYIYDVQPDGQATRYLVEEDTVGQFTGLKDADGREIYEGDILQKRDELAWRTVDRGVVFWHSDECRWCVEMRDGLVFSLTSRKSNTWRVIGNIYDNPELIKK